MRPAEGARRMLKVTTRQLRSYDTRSSLLLDLFFGGSNQHLNFIYVHTRNYHKDVVGNYLCRGSINLRRDTAQKYERKSILDVLFYRNLALSHLKFQLKCDCIWENPPCSEFYEIVVSYIFDKFYCRANLPPSLRPIAHFV